VFNQGPDVGLMMEISILDDPGHPICLALDNNGIDSASGMSLISPQNLTSLSYMDRPSGNFKTLSVGHRQLLLMLSGFAVHFDNTHGRSMTTQDWLATTVGNTMTYFCDSPAFQGYLKAYRYSVLICCVASDAAASPAAASASTTGAPVPGTPVTAAPVSTALVLPTT
jgi:hypothetical protein